MTEEYRISLNQAVPLATAMIALISRDLGIPMLVLKGPLAVELLVRPRGTSADVDVLISPNNLKEIGFALMEKGWMPRNPSSFERPIQRMSQHSTTYYHTNWPCDIDIHHRFPGFDKESNLVFRELWSKKQERTLANIDVHVPSLLDSQIIQLLHSLRTPDEVKNKTEYDFLFCSTLLPDSEVLISRSRSLGALGAIRPFIADRYGQSVVQSWPSISSEWKSRTIMQATGGTLLAQILNDPWRKKPASIAAAIFPSKDTLLQNRIGQDPGTWISLGKLHIRRTGRFLKNMPELLGQYRLYRNRKPTK